ncbi:MAG: AAA family ATPase [Bacteroidota bacterium]
MKKLPIGIQSIQEIIDGGYVYVDKTNFAYQLISTGKHYFLSRPRRFGKSLFLNTLAAIFRGNKELFKDCAIYKTDYDWAVYPVISMSLYKISSRTLKDFEEGLKRMVRNAASLHQLSVDIPTPQEGIDALVKALSKKHNQQVVVLIDEYDKPIISNLNNLTVAEDNRQLIREFFGTLKELDEFLKFTFVTGISKFSKVSLFSGGNHLDDITMDPAYATMLGYTEEELRDAFHEHIQAIVKAKNTPREAILTEVKQWYNGYRFTEDTTCVYNPFSTLKYMRIRQPQNYWYDTGTPSFLIEQTQRYPKNLLSLSGVEVSANRLSGSSKVEYIDVATLMFQTGYLTITDYSELERAYRLDFPNREVREAFLDSLLNELTDIDSLSVMRAATQLREAFETLDIPALIKALNIHFAKIA